MGHAENQDSDHIDRQSITNYGKVFYELQVKILFVLSPSRQLCNVMHWNVLLYCYKDVESGWICLKFDYQVNTLLLRNYENSCGTYFRPLPYWYELWYILYPMYRTEQNCRMPCLYIALQLSTCINDTWPFVVVVTIVVRYDWLQYRSIQLL